MARINRFVFGRGWSPGRSHRRVRRNHSGVSRTAACAPLPGVLPGGIAEVRGCSGRGGLRPAQAVLGSRVFALDPTTSTWLAGRTRCRCIPNSAQRMRPSRGGCEEKGDARRPGNHCCFEAGTPGTVEAMDHVSRCAALHPTGDSNWQVQARGADAAPGSGTPTTTWRGDHLDLGLRGTAAPLAGADHCQGRSASTCPTAFDQDRFGVHIVSCQ